MFVDVAMRSKPDADGARRMRHITLQRLSHGEARVTDRAKVR
jgi:hypothetical protein